MGRERVFGKRKHKKKVLLANLRRRRADVIGEADPTCALGNEGSDFDSSAGGSADSVSATSRVGLSPSLGTSDTVQDSPLPEDAPTPFVLDGRRIIDVRHFLSSLQGLKHERFDCGFADMDIVSEQRRGLCSSFTMRCRMCDRVDVVSTEKPSEQDRHFVSVNALAVQGIISIGSGFSGLSEFFGALDIPPGVFHSFSMTISSSLTGSFGYFRVIRALSSSVIPCTVRRKTAAGFSAESSATCLILFFTLMIFTAALSGG